MTVCNTIIEPTVWTGCYADSWKGLLVDEAFQHPAKFAVGLITRIIEHGIEAGYWRAGEVMGDPFGGIGGGGIIAAYHGIGWVGVELEEKFVKLAEANFGRHRRKWAAAGDPLPEIIQGDSRRFAEIVGGCDAITTSPPYAETALNEAQRQAGNAAFKLSGPEYVERADYGQTPGQIGNEKQESYWDAMRLVYEQCRIALKPGGVMAVVIKDYVKDKARVSLCDQTLTLLEHLGFVLIERVRAMMVEERRMPSLFGGEIVKRKERKSFFRRLAEKKGSPRIDWEEVLFVRSSGPVGALKAGEPPEEEA